MSVRSLFSTFLACAALSLTASSGCSDGSKSAGGTGGSAGTGGAGGTNSDAGAAGADGSLEGSSSVAHTLYVAQGETLIAFDIATGQQKAGAITNILGPTDMQVTPAGTLMVNLTNNNQVLAVDTATFMEVARIQSSDVGATRPVHSFITPAFEGKQYWAANNDGVAGMAATNSIRFVDINKESPTFLKAVGEIGLGIGHHKNAFTPNKARLSISNIADCATVMQIIDYTDVTNPTLVAKWSAAEIAPTIDCAMTGAGPHGAAPASNGRGYHNLTGWGVIMSIDQESDPPTFKTLATDGDGAGYTKAGKDGRYIYSLQRTPRAGDTAKPGAACQIGNLVVIDSMTDAVVKQLPLLYTGADCTESLPVTATRVGPDNIQVSLDGKTLFIASQGAPATGSTEVHFSNQHLVVDVTDPANPVQKPSIATGSHSGHRPQRISGDGKFLFVINNNDRTITQIDTETLMVARTLTLTEVPRQVATYGSSEGPSLPIGPH